MAPFQVCWTPFNSLIASDTRQQQDTKEPLQTEREGVLAPWSLYYTQRRWFKGALLWQAFFFYLTLDDVLPAINMFSLVKAVKKTVYRNRTPQKTTTKKNQHIFGWMADLPCVPQIFHVVECAMVCSRDSADLWEATFLPAAPSGPQRLQKQGGLCDASSWLQH